MGKVKEYYLLQEEKELYQVKENKTNLTFNAEISKEIETFIKAIMPDSGFYWLAQIGKIKNTLKYTNIEDYIYDENNNAFVQNQHESSHQASHLKDLLHPNNIRA